MESNSAPLDSEPAKHFHSGVVALGIGLIVGATVLACRLIWEMTSLTWQQGPQMVGFSLAHGVGALLFLFPIGLFLWACTCLITLLVWRAKGKQIERSNWITLGIAAFVLGILTLPQGFWDTLFVSQLAKSPKAATILVYASGSDEEYVVHSLLKRGLSVNATDREGNTPLHFAAGAGHTRLVSYLLDHGADVNSVNLWGDSPLQRANSEHQTKASQILLARGGKDIKGDEAQRERAAQQIVTQEMQEIHE